MLWCIARAGGIVSSWFHGLAATCKKPVRRIRAHGLGAHLPDVLLDLRGRGRGPRAGACRLPAQPILRGRRGRRVLHRRAARLEARSAGNGNLAVGQVTRRMAGERAFSTWLLSGPVEPRCLACASVDDVKDAGTAAVWATLSNRGGRSRGGSDPTGAAVDAGLGPIAAGAPVGRPARGLEVAQFVGLAGHVHACMGAPRHKAIATNEWNL